jgi:AraC family transcriptional regulator, regulatory protein of adaptative response / DNA-3-methyladenine glycosylase II
VTLDPEACYRAIASRDRRFEGRFVVGVLSTGIYCRPGCPARTPRRDRVTFFERPHGAEEAGFRACLRCKPDATWRGTSATVARAMRLIEDGALDGGSLDGLAERLGLGGRHLRRLFAEHVGASPLEVARTRRVAFARRLLTETGLRVIDVAHAAGFGSVRRLNAAFTRAYGAPPRDVRKATAASETLSLELPFKPPFDAASLFGFLATRAAAGVEAGDTTWYARSFPGGTLTVRAGERSLTLKVQAGPSTDLLAVVARVRRVFDLGADPLRIAADLGRDPILAARVTAFPGLRIPGSWDPFECAVRAVLGQQVSVAAATTLAGRVVRAHGAPSGTAAPLDGNGGWRRVDRLFPTPAALVDASLEGLGLVSARATAIRAIARAALDGTFPSDSGRGLEDAIERLVALPGVGPWTASYIAMRALGETDSFPAGDLAVRKALGGCTEREARARAEAWRPWRGYATMLLWRGLS